MITIFKSIKETDTPFFKDIIDILDRVRNGNSKDLIEQIRQKTEKSERNEIKKLLPAILFSGQFTKRSDNSIVEHSGYICLDFDGFPSESEMIKKKKELEKDIYTMSVFVSPSGDGLKVIVKIPKDIENHKKYFSSLENYYDCKEFDTSCKNISRVCYESYDADIYVNEFSKEWTTLEEEEHVQFTKNESPNTIFLNDHFEIVRRLELWWNKKYGMVEGSKNNNLFILASSLNSFGIDKTAAELVLSKYDEGGKKDEIKTIIQSAYKDVIAFGTKAFEDTNSIDKIRKSIKSGSTKSEIKAIMRDHTGYEVDAVIRKIQEDSSINEFWRKDEKGRVYMVPHLFKEFLEDSGFYKYYPNGSSNFVFVKVVNNLIHNTSEDEVKDFVMNFLIGLDDLSMFNFFADKTKYFKEDFLSILSPVDISFVSDTKDEAYLYYKNCAVRITKESIDTIDYIDLDGYVWADQVIDRDFSTSDNIDCDFKKFISNISGDESQRVLSVESTIGFLLHGFKNNSYCPAIIINDEVISDNPEGGTGKGLFVNAISQLKKTVKIDGKEFSFGKSFPYQLISADTQIVSFDDIDRGFTFEKLFSIITEGITLEKKNKDAIKIPFEKSPKIVITTNYALKGSGNSFERRKWELEFKRFYSMNFTPRDEFNRFFYTEWDSVEWLKFDNYMLNCLKRYLDTGFVKSEFKNLKERRFIAETEHSFWEWITDVDCEYNKRGMKFHRQDAYNRFTVDYPDFAPKSRNSLTLNRFYKWLDSYSVYSTGRKPLTGKDANGKWMMFVEKDRSESAQIDLDF